MALGHSLIYLHIYLLGAADIAFTWTISGYTCIQSSIQQVFTELQLCARCGSKAFEHISEPKGKDSPVQVNRQTINKKRNRKVNCIVFSKVVSAEQRKATTGKGKKGLGLRARGAVVTWSSQGEPH